MTLDQMNPKAIIGALVTVLGWRYDRTIYWVLSDRQISTSQNPCYVCRYCGIIGFTNDFIFWNKIILIPSRHWIFNSIMFPTIFTLAIDDLGDQKPQGSGILVTAICGGAFIPPAVGAIADVTSFPVAFILPLICYVIIAGLANHYLGQASN